MAGLFSVSLASRVEVVDCKDACLALVLVGAADINLESKAAEGEERDVELERLGEVADNHKYLLWHLIYLLVKFN